MSWATIRDALVTRLEAVSGTGRVHSFLRYLKEGPDQRPFTDAYVVRGRLNYWAVTRTARRSVKTVGDDSYYRRHHDVEVNVFVALSDSDESEHVFQDLLDTVANNLETGDHTLGGVCLTHTPPEVRQIGHAMISDILCHSALLFLTVEEVA